MALLHAHEGATDTGRYQWGTPACRSGRNTIDCNDAIFQWVLGCHPTGGCLCRKPTVRLNKLQEYQLAGQHPAVTLLWGHYDVPFSLQQSTTRVLLNICLTCIYSSCRLRFSSANLQQLSVGLL